VPPEATTADLGTAARASLPGAAVLTLAFCFTASLCEGYDVQAAGIAAGGISAAFHPGPGPLGGFFSAGSFGLMLGAILGGWLSDRIGRRRVLIASITAFGLFSLATSQAWDMGSLTALRFLTGLGLGGAMPNLIGLAADAGGDRPHSGHIALSYIGMPVGGAIASLAALVLPQDHWRQLFLIGGAAPLVIAAAMAAALPRATRQTAAREAAAPLRELFGGTRALRTLMLWLGFFLLVLTLHLLLNWLPLLLRSRGLSKDGAALAQIGFNLGGGLGALAIGQLLDGRWRRPAVVLVAVALPVLLVLLAGVGGSAMIPVALGVGIAVLGGQVILFAVAGGLYPQAVRGAGLGAAVGVGRLGSIAGPAFAAALLAAGRSAAQVLTALLPMAMAFALCMLFLAWRAANTASATQN